MKFILICLTLVSISSYSKAQTDSTNTADQLNVLQPEWIYIAQSSSHDKWYIKNMYEEKDGTKIKIWTKTILATFNYHNKIYKKVEAKNLYTFNCDNKTYESNYAVFYTSFGNVLFEDAANYTAETIVPDTMLEEIYNAVCMKYNN